MPFPIAALAASFAPSLVSHLFGGSRNPDRDLQSKLMGLMSPDAIASLTNQIYQQNLGSPAFAQAQGNIAAGANVAQNTIGRELGARGIGTSGTGAVLSGLVPSMVGSQQAQLRTGAHASAQQAAMQQIQQQIQALLGARGGGPSTTAQLAGVGMDAFRPILMAWLKNKYPNLGL